MGKVLFEVDQVSKSFREDFWKSKFFALSDVSFKIYEGDIVGFLGANGAGKTTLIKIILGLLHADKGRIHFSKNLGRNPVEVKKQIGFLPEGPYFYHDLTGKEFIEYLMILSAAKINDHKITKWFEKLKIAHAMDKKIRFYSKGMLQRLGIISAFMHKPKIAILDEPLSGLDPVGRRDIKDIILEANRKSTTIFLSSHILSDIEEVSSHIVLLRKGKLVYDGMLEQMLNTNSSPHYEIYIRSEQLPENLEGKTEKLSKLNNMYKTIVAKEHLNKTLSKILKQNAEIEQVQKIKKTLEEVAFKL